MKSRFQSMDQTFNQSFNKSINQSANQPIHSFIDESTLDVCTIQQSSAGHTAVHDCTMYSHSWYGTSIQQSCSHQCSQLTTGSVQVHAVACLLNRHQMTQHILCCTPPDRCFACCSFAPACPRHITEQKCCCLRICI